MSKESDRKATQVNQGWRVEKKTGERQSTQVDTGWRAAGTPSREATQVDEGRRAAGTPGREATQVDEGWRAAGAPGREATQVDEGWRAAGAPGREATQVDEGWRRNPAEWLDPTNVMNKATANFFPTLQDFQAAVAKLPALTSSTGQVYPVKQTLSTAGGESVVLLCAAPDGGEVAAKVYYEPVNSAGSSISARSRVLEYMGTEEGREYTLAVQEIGLVSFGESKYYFEISPFCAEGDLSDDGAFSFDEIVALTKRLNEALHSIHQAGILHRDIKPHNIYKTEHGVVLGDFGVAKLAENGRSNVTRHIVGTDGYSAPELRLGLTDSPAFIYDTKSDYYSLGVTLGSLFEGHFVYEGMDEAMVLLSVRNGRLPLKRIDPRREQLENLLNGLCRFDSKYRFGYEDVCKWLVDHNYTGGIVEEEWPRAFRMLGEEYRDEKSLFCGITKDEAHWNEGRNMLFSKFFEHFFVSFRTDLARAAQLAEESYRREDRDKGLAVFLKSLFAPGAIVWKGYTFRSLRELGEKMVATKTPAAYAELLQRHCISHWLSNTEGIRVEEDTRQLVDAIEALSATEPELACYWFGNSFAEQRRLEICGCSVSTIAALLEALFAVPNRFYQGDGYRKLLSRRDGADLYGFLFSFGYKEVVLKAWEKLGKCDLFNKTTILLSMLEQIAMQAGVNPAILRSFFVEYGPIGLATYTKKLASQAEHKTYLPLDSDGKRLLAKVADFKAPAAGTVDELFRGYLPLVEHVERLHRSLIENPHCIMTGVYENRGVICTNLLGCFAFRIFDREAPLGFNAWIESANGGTQG